MDRLESLGNSLSQITLYDIKSMYNQAKNVVLNVSEMEAKVREATNDEPWGASSTLMQEIAQGTFSFQYFNEIMPCIYARFMEKEARQWRQIYKALQLLEYLIKHGSERVVDDARSHISTIKMLRNFHYIDDKGKDEGANVRNRSRELVEMLSDVEKIRAERRKAKQNKNKYIGTGSDGFSGAFSGGRYGGFGSDSLGDGGSSSYGNDYGSYSGGSGSGGGGRASSSFRDDNRRGGFEEYNAGDDEVITKTPQSPTQPRSSTHSVPTRKATAPTPIAAPPPPVVDLLGGLDDDTFSSTTNTTTSTDIGTNKALPTMSKPAVGIDDDDFADFQAAPLQTTVAAAPTHRSSPSKPNLMDMLSNTAARTTSPLGRTTFTPSYGQAQQPNTGLAASPGSTLGAAGFSRSTQQSMASPPMFASPISPTQQTGFAGASMKPSTNLGGAPLRPNTTTPQPKSPPTGGSANFDDLWNLSLGSNPKPAATNGGKSIKDLEREKALAGLWGNQTPNRPAYGGSSAANSFRSFGTSTTTPTATSNASASAGDDLLL